MKFIASIFLHINLSGKDMENFLQCDAFEGSSKFKA